MNRRIGRFFFNLHFLSIIIFNDFNFEDFWIAIECKLNQSVPICIKRILGKCAYDSEMSLSELNEINLLRIESFAQESLRYVIDGLNCCHSETYRNQNIFQFIPGHRAFILAIPEKLKSNSAPVTLSILCQQLIEFIEYANGHKSFE